MVSEDVEKIIALIIVTFAFLSIPILLFIFIIAIYFDINYVIQFYRTGNFANAFMAVLLAIGNAVLFLFLRALIKWIRK
ncbi:hypothetical protein DRO69_11675 [Candidatus Bathyarchaeota archaeon]|nr:MAG: hypothetical protein DRO69_11675 [Candidatus Bathyarchaeota archaeon]